MQTLPSASLLAVCTIVLMTFSAPANRAKADPPSLEGKRILFLGDSITDHSTYVALIEYYLDKQYPSAKFDVFNLGLASETVSGLSENAHPFPRPNVQERLWACLDLIKPDVVFACYGMNDGIYHPESPDRLAAFQKGIQKLIADCSAAGASVILLTPPPYDALKGRSSVLPITAPDFSYMHPYDHYDDVLAAYGKWELTLPSAEATVIDIHAPLLDYLLEQRKTDPTFSYSVDGIHPNAIGDVLIVRAILSALGMQVQTGTPEAEFAAVEADPMWPLVNKHMNVRADGWKPYVGYTREKVYKTDSIDQTETEAAALQSQIDSLRQAAQ